MLTLQDVESSTVLQHILKRPTHYNRSIKYRVLKLLSEVLIRRYPTVEYLTNSELMEWKMWPSILRMILGICTLLTSCCYQPIQHKHNLFP